MIGLLARVDQYAASATTPWHRASALGKLAVALLLIGLTVASPSLSLLLALHGIAWTLVVTARLPLKVALTAAAYPIVFVALFLLSRWDQTAATPLSLALRPITACLVAAWLVGTTPYPDLFAPLARVLPRGAGDGLFLTYRALFSLLGSVERLGQALRLRGGGSGSMRRRLSLAGEGLGTLVVGGFDRSQRLYQAMLLRGHSGRICGCRDYARGSRADLLSVAAAVALGSAAALLWRAP